VPWRRSLGLPIDRLSTIKIVDSQGVPANDALQPCFTIAVMRGETGITVSRDFRMEQRHWSNTLEELGVEMGGVV